MSVDRFIQLMVEDPELRQRLSDAGSNGERAAMVAEFGIEIPTEAQVTARVAELQEMRDVDGGMGIGKVMIWSQALDVPVGIGVVAAAIA